MAKVDYGAVALIPVGGYSASRQYHANELVGYQGSSYIALQNPPVGTLPTNTTYFMLHTEGTSIATASTPGTVKPDGTSTVVDANGAMSVKPSIVQTIQNTAETAADTAAKVGAVPSGKTVQSEIDGLEPRVSSSEDALTVNLLNPTRLQSQTYYGITIVRNSDNTFTLSGTNEKNETLYIVLEWLEDLAPKTVAGKRYKFFGIPSGLTGIQIKVGDVRDSGNGATFTAPPTGDRVSIIIPAGFSFSEPATFKPMITANLSATYDDYVPYSGSSGKLDTDYKALSDKIGNVGNTDLQSQLNAATQSIAQNTTDIATNAAGISALNTGLATLSAIYTVVFNDVSVQPQETKRVGEITGFDRLTKDFFPFHPNIIGNYFADQIVDISYYSNTSQPFVWIKNTGKIAFNGTVAVSYMLRNRT